MLSTINVMPRENSFLPTSEFTSEFTMANWRIIVVLGNVLLMSEL